MRTFTATTEGQNRLRLRELLQRYADEQWVANHLTKEQAAAAVLSTFKAAVINELKLKSVPKERLKQSTAASCGNSWLGNLPRRQLPIDRR